MEMFLEKDIFLGVVWRIVLGLWVTLVLSCIDLEERVELFLESRPAACLTCA